MGICCLPGESCRARAAPGWRSFRASIPAGVQDSRKVERKGREPGSALGFGYLPGREEWASGVSKCQALPTSDVFHMKCVPFSLAIWAYHLFTVFSQQFTGLFSPPLNFSPALILSCKTALIFWNAFIICSPSNVYK